MAFNQVSHVIFDMDGLLLDTESVYDQIMEEIAREFGRPYTKEAKLKILGTTEGATALIAIKEFDLPYTPDEFLAIYKKKELEVADPSLMPGAAELVKHLHKHKIPIAVATSSSTSAMKLKTRIHQDVFQLFHHIVCGSDDAEVKQGKPAPDVFLVCASRFPDSPPPNMCLVFEDAPNGVKGARSAGMQVVMVPDHDVPQVQRQDANLVLESLRDFKPELFGLPAFD